MSFVAIRPVRALILGTQPHVHLWTSHVAIERHRLGKFQHELF